MGSTDVVPTGANCASQTFKYIIGNRVAREAIVATSRDQLLKALLLLPQGQHELFPEKSRGQSLFVSNVGCAKATNHRTKTPICDAVPTQSRPVQI